MGNPSGFDRLVAFIITGTASGPGDKVLVCGEDRHIAAYFRKDLDCSEWVFVKPGNRTD